ncbi:tRNA guanosine(34) transglycosylase Tgt [Patescibacteria group bacterium]|nr:tRNA guanosine(34) transglycosylase Tgt [Patescibacteria group bacterium]
MPFFRILKKSKKSKARTGIIQTKHGKISTPSFVPVATKGTLKTIPPRDLVDIGVQVAFVNTFHLTVHPGVDVIKKFGGIHKYSNLNIPLMSDSAGFQVFSLGQGKPKKAVKTRDGEEVLLQRIDERGVKFRSPKDGKEMMFTPELSIKNQEKIGADMIMAFDECIYYGANYTYTKEATDRTHRWLKRCIKAHKKKDQYLYGIIQGGVFKDLRIGSAEFVVEQKIDGIAIGGVAIGETSKEIREQVRWVVPYLPGNKPVHLLGVGRVEDILDLVGEGIDTFDCVEPTRLARNGMVYHTTSLKLRGTKKVERIDLTKRRYVADKNPIQKGCRCYTCQNFSLAYLHHLFKEKELLGYYLTTYHNLYFFGELFKGIRKQISKGLL